MPESDIYTTPNRCLFILIALKGRDDINVRWIREYPMRIARNLSGVCYTESGLN